VELYAAAPSCHRQQLDTFFVPPILDALRPGWDADRTRDRMAANDGTADQPKAPAIARQPRYGPEQPGFCKLHRCPLTVCFCWD